MLPDLGGITFELATPVCLDHHASALGHPPRRWQFSRRDACPEFDFTDTPSMPQHGTRLHCAGSLSQLAFKACCTCCTSCCECRSLPACLRKQSQQGQSGRYSRCRELIWTPLCVALILRFWGCAILLGTLGSGLFLRSSGQCETACCSAKPGCSPLPMLPYWFGWLCPINLEPTVADCLSRGCHRTPGRSELQLQGRH